MEEEEEEEEEDAAHELLWHEYSAAMHQLFSDEFFDAMRQWAASDWLQTDLRRIFRRRVRSLPAGAVPPAALDDLPELPAAALPSLQREAFVSYGFLSKYLETSAEERERESPTRAPCCLF